MRSGDVELNPGPEQNVDNQTRLSVDSTTLLRLRLGQLGLRALDVGGAGDCFFRAVSPGINCMVIPIATFTSDKLLFSTLDITLKVSLKAILRIRGMIAYNNNYVNARYLV